MGEAKRRKEGDPNYGTNRQILDLRRDKSSGMFDNLPPGLTSYEYLEYLDQNWDVLACAAYDFYLREGKGFLLVDWDLSFDRAVQLLPDHIRQHNSPRSVVNFGQTAMPVLYIGERSPLFIGMGGKWFDSRWKQLIQGYDPATMIVLGLSWNFSMNPTDGGIMVRTLANPKFKTPVELYIENADRLVESTFHSHSGEPISVRSKSVRLFEVQIAEDASFRASVHAYSQSGWAKHGKGAIVAIPHANGFQLMFAPVDHLNQAFDRDSSELWEYLETCDPAHYAVVTVLESDLETIKKKPDFAHFPLLISFKGDDLQP